MDNKADDFVELEQQAAGSVIQNNAVIHQLDKLQ